MIDVITLEFDDWSQMDGQLKQYSGYKLRYIFQEHYPERMHKYKYIVIIEKEEG